MNYILRDIKATSIYQKIIESKEDPIEISGLARVFKSVLISAIKTDGNKPILLITYNEIQAKNLIKDLSYFIEDVSYLSKREIALYNVDAESSEIEFERINIINNMSNKKSLIYVTTIEAIMQKIIAKKSLYENIIEIKNEDTIDIAEIKQKLISLGYIRKDLTESRGEFSVRGNIIDIGIDKKEGYRIELWGDEVDSIRKFRLDSQRSIEMQEKIKILPSTEKVLACSVDKVCRKIEEKYSQNGIIDEDILKDIEEIKNGNYRTKIDKYFNEFYEEQECILDYAKNFKIFFDEPEKIEQRIDSIKNDTKNLIKELIEKERAVPEALKNLCEFELKADQKNVINLREADTRENNFKLREITILENDLKNVEEEANKAIKNKKKVIILAGNKESRDKIAKLVQNSIKVDDIDNIILKESQIIISTGVLSTGYENKETGLIVLSSNEIFSKSKSKIRAKASTTFKSGEKIVFADLKVNDLVVHRNHGIGIFIGVKTITVDNLTKDYMAIKYRNDDILYVPTNNLDNVRKYIGEASNLKLNKLGGKEWQETKAKVKKNLRTVAKELIELYAKRENSKGYAFSKDTPWQTQFEDSFPYTETDDQLRCIAEVKKDMEQEKPMDRLLCGDVGYGKTEVAIRGAFKAVMDGKQVAYLAPTTVLANQQYQEFKERMKDFPITIELLNRFRTKKEQTETVNKLKQGKVDIVVGTHRILSKDVEFSNLGLLIIDEEHRFGVKDKEKIKQYKASVDVLTMTATPIPRTMQMSIVGIRDMSVIYDPPQDRKPIQTYVLEYDTELIKEAIIKEIERGGQIFYIFNNVQNIASKALRIQELVPEAKVSYAHGKMGGEEIEDIMQEFVEGKTNVLVCTTILESGIDIPNANTIIVENSDRFGLAQLYQIRGRVGRSNKQAFAYITYRKDKIIGEDAMQRLKAIKEFTEFGSGFKIATRDLQIRGAGSIFGEVQSGHIEQIGYDMYNKLLEEVIKETKGEIIKEEEEITIDINISSFIPESYIEDASQKIEIYQDIADCRNEEDIQNIIDEIIDRYGNMPAEVENLIKIARIKNLCKEKNVIKIQERPNGIAFTFSEIDRHKVADWIEIYKTNIRYSETIKPMVTISEKKDAITVINEFLNKI